MAPLITLLTSALCIWLAQLAYWLPLKRRKKYQLRFLLDLIATVPFAQVITWANSGRTTAPALIAMYIGYFLWVGISTRLCTPLDAAASAYCSVWIVLTSESIYELWRLLIWVAARAGLQQPALTSVPMLLGQIGFTFAVCVLVRYTVARLMPDEGLYRIGPRQLLSAALLGGMFIFQFFALMSTLQNESVGLSLVAPAFLTQLYCLTLLYLQTELFKKSAMQKEMDTLNLLYERQRQQYQIARQNVQIINRKCHELKVQIADLRRLNPDAAAAQNVTEAERAVQLYDATADTGNEVLDVVLTEKAMLCEAQHITLNCVADGSAVTFVEPGDLYALFSNALDQAIDAAARQMDEPRRMIDLLVCKRQGFIVINVIAPAVTETPTRTARQHHYEQKVMRSIVQKYNGTMTKENQNTLSAVKIVLPPPKP